MLQAAALDRAETLQDLFFGVRGRIKKEKEMQETISHLNTNKPNNKTTKAERNLNKLKLDYDGFCLFPREQHSKPNFGVSRGGARVCLIVS